MREERMTFEIDNKARPFEIIDIISRALQDHYGLSIRQIGISNNPTYYGLGSLYHAGIYELYDLDEELKLDPRRELSYEERIDWFIASHYETGMEREILLESLKDDDLDNFKWYNDTIKFPKTQGDLDKYNKK